MRPSATLRSGVLRRDLRAIFAEGVSFSVMVGIGESYLPAFVLALGLGEVASGLVTTIPLLAGGVIQLATPLGVRRLGSRRRWSVLCASIQAASFVPLIVGAAAGDIPGWLVFLVATLYWASGMAVGPAWNPWVERLVPVTLRARYFARRSGAVHVGVLAGFLGGGLILEAAGGRGSGPGGSELLGFAAIFALALAGRAVSARLLATQSEPEDETPAPADTRDLLGLVRFPADAGGHLIRYLLLLTAGVTVASPFFSAYMLTALGLPYWKYTTLVGVSLLAKVLSLPLIRRVAKRFGLIVVLRAAWVGVAPVPLLWLVSDSYGYLLALQAFSGVAWAAHEYVTFLLLFETIPGRRRTSVLTAFNLGHAVTTVGGSVLGGWAFGAVGGERLGYEVLFWSSTAARAACLALLLRVRTGRIPALPVAFRIVAVRPATGVVLRPILATIRRVRGRNDEDGRSA